MRISTGLRGLRAVGAMMLLCVWSLNPSLYFLKSLIEQAGGIIDGKADGNPVLSAHAIQAPQQAKEICHHHLQGCPKDCFCPKITPDQFEAQELSGDISGGVSGAGGYSGDASSRMESLHQPILVQCTEDTAAAGPPAGVTALADPIREIRMHLWVVGSCPSPLIPSLLEAPKDPPLKIPIA